MAEKIAIVGAGLIGRAWAVTFARGGYDVALHDPVAAAIPKALVLIDEMLANLEKSDLLRGQSAGTVRPRIKAAASLEEALDGAIHVQENSPEEVETKRVLFAKLDAVAGPNTVLASSSSGIVPSLFTESLAGRNRCLVAHPINPPYLVPAVELVPAPWTDAATMAKTRALMEAIGQAPMTMTREIDGFIMNRLQGALLQEAFRLVADGYASAEDVDIGIRKGLGLRWAFMGPFETIDLNAPGGVADYVARYGGMYRKLWPSQTKMADWDALAPKLEAERKSRLPRGDLDQRQQWRDRRLMALLRHLSDAERDIGK